ncbi:F-box/WD repeat-containing protein 10, partial [Ophiophagus hannah]
MKRNHLGTTALEETQLSKRYGPVFTIWLGTKPMVVICGIEAVKDALITHNEEFGGRPPVPILDRVTKGFGLISKHEKWKMVRRFTISTLRNFGMGKKSMSERISEETHCLVYSTLPNIMNFLPGPHKKIFSDCKKVCDFIRNEVDTHKETLDPDNPRDFIDCFLLKLEKEQNSSIICMEDLVMSVFQLFIGGTDTTSSVISYALVVLARFSDVQVKIHQEIDEIVGANRAPSMEDRMKLPYTNAFVHEILRILRITNENFPRMTTQDVNFRGHFIPQGTAVLPLLVSMHFDPLCWEDPENFHPSHFLDKKGEFQKKDAYLPFSAGKRACPGEALADMELFLIFSILLQHFTFELIIDPEEIDLEALYLGCRKKGKYHYLRAIKHSFPSHKCHLFHSIKARRLSMLVELMPGAIILFIVFLLIFWVFQFQQERAKFPPGPTPWFFLGNLLQKDVLPLYKTYPKLAKKYGPVFTIWLGPKPLVVVCGYEAVKDALITHSEEFGGRSPIPILDEISKGYDQPFDVVPTISAAVSNVICAVIFGKRFSYDDKIFIETLEILKKFIGFFLSAPGMVYSAMPHIMKFLPGPHNRAVTDCIKICDYIRTRVDSHKKTLDPDDPRDFIDCFLIKLEKVYYKDISHTRTTSTEFQLCTSKMQQEIDDVVGPNRQPTMEDKVKLPYTNAFAHELLRFQPGSGENFPRTTTQNVIFKGHFIPRGTTVLPLWASVHFDPLCWDNPRTFDPAHFLDKNGEFQKKDAYLPFSAGNKGVMADLGTSRLNFTFELTADPKEIDLENLFMGCRGDGKHRYIRAIRQIAVMKTPSVEEVEPDLEYKLQYTPDLRCEKETDLVPVCYRCKSCILSWKIFSTREWFVRASQATQRTFVMGIINRFQSHDLLKYSWNLLQAIDTKDFTYSRSCVSSTFRASSVLDRAMDPQKLAQSMADLWRWFGGSCFWTKANYILLLLQMCDSKLLLMAATLIRILLGEHETAMEKGNIRVQKIWSKQSDNIFKKALYDLENETNYFAVLTLHPTTPPASPQQSSSKFRDFIRYLPIHLSKSILRMLDMKTLARCASVSPHWNFLIKQLKCDIIANYALRSQISVFQDYDQQQTTNQGEDTEYMQKAYHGQETDTIKLEERNVFCSGYNVRILINSLDSNRVIHSTTGRLLAFGSLDRKVHFLDIEKIKNVPPIFSGHAGSIRSLYLHEDRGFLLSGSYDLSIRRVSLMFFYLGLSCIKCIEIQLMSKQDEQCAKKLLHLLVFLTVWDMKTGRCIKTFTHKAYVWAAKMNEVHIVTSCDKGLVKVWHAESYVLIKVLEGHRGAIKCLSFDEWHLVTGSSDGYILAWSMVGKHKRCLMGFRHPKEVLSLAFVYLRVISGCADGKIRIFNFFSGICLRVMRANSRGDPVVSFCILQNRLLINAEGSVVLFQFEEVEWDHNQLSDRLPNQALIGKFHDIPTPIKPPPYSKSVREKRARKKNWKLYREVDDTVLSYYISQHATQLSKDAPGIYVCADEELVSEAPPTSLFDQNTKALLNHLKKRHPIGPISNDQVLLTVSTVHHAYQHDNVSANMAYNMNIKDAWEPVQPKKIQPKPILSSQSSKYKATDLANQVKQLKAAGVTLGMEKISSPYETKLLQLNTKKSLLGSTVKSLIPPPSITRSKSCSSLSRRKGYFKISSSTATESNIIGGFTSSAESIKIPRMKIAQPDTNVTSRRRKFFHALSANPYRYNSGFQLLTTQQMKEYEEAKIAEYQATKTKVIANREKVCKNAWVRKIKGLPIDDFTKEGRTAAPELGDVFI